MKKGMILYVTQGKEEVPLQGVSDLIEASRSMGVAAVCVATNEDDVAYGWWQLIAKGVHQVLFMTVDYNPTLERFESRSAPVRIYG